MIIPQFGIGALGLSPPILTTLPTGFSLAGSTYVVANVMRAETTNAITSVRFVCWKSAGTSPVYRVSLQSLDANGHPSGTVLGGGSPASATFSESSSTPVIKTVVLDNAYTPSADEQFAIVIDYVSGTINFSNYISVVVAIGHFTNFNRTLHHYVYSFQSSASLSIGWNAMQAVTASERYGGTLIKGANAVSFAPATKSVSTTGHRVATKFTVPASLPLATFDLIGFTTELILAASESLTFGVWNSSGTALASIASVDTDKFQVAFASRFTITLDSALSISPGDVLYCGVESVSGSTIAMPVLDFDSTTDRDAVGSINSGASQIYSQWNGSSWTDSAVDVPACQLLVVDATAQGGVANRGILSGGSL